jgi:hypothetical protein
LIGIKVGNYGFLCDEYPEKMCGAMYQHPKKK